MDSWYYKIFGAEFGPVTLEEIILLVQGQSISVNDEVRFGENGEWCPVGAIEELVQQIPQKAHTASVVRTTPSPVTSALPPAPAINPAPAPAPVFPPISSPATDPRFEIRSTANATAKSVVWYYKVFGVEYGPVTLEQLIELARSQSLFKNDEIRSVELGAWCPAASVGDLTSNVSLQLERPAMLWPDPTVAFEMSAAAWQSVNAASGSSGAATNSASETKNLWWCKIRGQDYGPVECSKVAFWGESGVLRHDDYVRRGNGEFVLASEMPGLIPKPGSTPAFQDRLGPQRTEEIEEEDSPTSEAEEVLQSHSRPTSRTRRKARISEREPSFDANTETFGERLAEQLATLSKRYAIHLAGVVGACLLAAIVYTVLPLLMEGNKANIDRLNELQTALKEMQQIRNKDTIKNEDFHEAVTNLESAAKSVELATRGSRTANQKAIRSLAKTFLLIAEQDDFTKPSSAEKAAEQAIPKIKRRLGVK